MGFNSLLAMAVFVFSHFTQEPCSLEEKGDIPVKERERFSNEIKSWVQYALFLCFASFLHPNKFTVHGVNGKVQSILILFLKGNLIKF